MWSYAAIAECADKYKHILTPDKGAPYDQLVEIDLDEVCYFMSTYGVLCLCLTNLASAACQWTIYSRPCPPHLQVRQYSSGEGLAVRY